MITCGWFLQGVQLDIAINTDKQKTKVEAIQKLLDNLKTLQKEERVLDIEIKQMMVQLSQTTQATDGLKERLVHCSAALNVLANLSGPAGDEHGVTTTQASASAQGAENATLLSGNDSQLKVEQKFPDISTVPLPKSVPISDTDIAFSSESITPIPMDITTTLKAGDVINLQDMEAGDAGVILKNVFDSEEISIHDLKAELLVDHHSVHLVTEQVEPGDVTQSQETSQDFAISSQETSQESSLENEHTESSQDISESSQDWYKVALSVQTKTLGSGISKCSYTVG